MSRLHGRHEEAGTIEPRLGRPVPTPSRSATWARVVGAAGLLLLTMTLYWLLTDESFRVSAASVSIEGVQLTDESRVRERIQGLERSPNVFRVRASEVVEELQGLPGVSAASATVLLPASIEIHLTEHAPIFAWSNGVSTWLVDETGRLFAPTSDDGRGGEAAPSDPDPDAPGDPEADSVVDPDRVAETDVASQPGPAARLDVPAGLAADDPALLRLPRIEDHRLTAIEPVPGAYLPSIDLQVMRQLLALTPELLSSRSDDLRLSIDERDGYVLRSRDPSWQAVFGHYTPTLQPPDVVPRQVQCLRWLLAARERRIVRVRLVPSGAGCGTFTEVRRAG